MANNTKKKGSQKKKQSFNMYAWMNKNKKSFAGAICILLVLAMVIGIMM